MSAAEQASWRTIPGFHLHWHSWNHEFVVYHTGSGDTHLLNLAAAAVLQRLQDRPAMLAELTEYATSRLGIEADEAFMHSMVDLVKDLTKLGLIERVEQ